MYRLLTLIISVLRVALKLDNNTFQSVDRASRMAADITSRRLAGEQASQRQEEMSGDGNEWGEWTEPEAAFELSGSHLIVIRGSQCRTNFYGPLRLDLGEDQLTLFDFGIYLGERQSRLAPILQTVGSYRISDLKVPQFYIRPVLNHSSVRNEFLSCYETVDSMPAHSHNQIAESIFPGRAAELLETKTAFVELLPLLQDRQLTVEWTGETLLVYRLQQTVGREEMKEFAQEVVHVAQILRAANEEASAALDQRIAAATQS